MSDSDVVDAGGRAFVLAFAPDAPDDWGPIPVSPADVRGAFGDRWRVASVESTQFETRRRPVPGVLGIFERI